jgi:hypothetical protein
MEDVGGVGRRGCSHGAWAQCCRVIRDRARYKMSYVACWAVSLPRRRRQWSYHHPWSTVAYLLLSILVS